MEVTAVNEIVLSPIASKARQCQIIVNVAPTKCFGPDVLNLKGVSEILTADVAGLTLLADPFPNPILCVLGWAITFTFFYTTLEQDEYFFSR